VGLALLVGLGDVSKVNQLLCRSCGAESGWEGGECAAPVSKGPPGDEGRKSSAAVVARRRSKLESGVRGGR